MLATIYSPDYVAAQAEFIQAGERLGTATGRGDSLEVHTAGSILESARCKLLIMGAGDAAMMLLRELKRSQEWRVVGLLDDDLQKRGRLRNRHRLGRRNECGRLGVGCVIGDLRGNHCGCGGHGDGSRSCSGYRTRVDVHGPAE